MVVGANHPCIYNSISIISNLMQIKSAVASIEDSGDGPLDEELDEITKVCVY